MKPVAAGRNPTASEYRVAGCRIHAVTIEDWLDVIAGAIEARERRILVGQNVHSAYLLQRDEGLRRLQERATIVRIDGLPLVLFARLLGHPVGRRHRSGFMDVLDPLLTRASQERWTVFYLGSRPEVAERAIDILKQRYSGVPISWHHGFFDPDDPVENSSIVDRINAASPDLLIVGMGMPRQEHWMLANEAGLLPPAIVASGAAMEYVAGVTPMAPRWLSAIGLEWLYRFANDPRRLGFRYLVEPWFVLAAFARQVLGRAVTQRRREH